jgi:hypothetical protein
MGDQLHRLENDENNDLSLQEPLLYETRSTSDNDEQHWIVDSNLFPADTSVFSGDLVSDGLPYKRSVLIKSLYFLDAL